MANDAPPPFAPTTFGRYTLLDRLAIGGMAEIFKARQTGVHGFERILVIKRILPSLAADPEFLAMFIDEAKLQCVLQHPKIVQVFEFGEVDGQYFIALEYVDGMDALNLLRACAHKRQRLPMRIAVYIACEVLDALDYAHAKRGPEGNVLGIVHRDVSPSNVFISRRGDVKLGDFGIARAAEPSRQSKTQTGTLKGKYGYMAPEQVVGGEIDGRADVFAVGIVLAEMLMGRRLFTAPNDLDVLLMVRDAKLDRLNLHGGEIPPALRKILDRMLARAPDVRYANAAATRDVLQEWLFESRQRVGASDLGGLIDLVSKPSEGPPPIPADGSLMGEDTRAKAEAAAKQKVAMAKAAAEPPPPPAKSQGKELADDDEDSYPIISFKSEEAPATPTAGDAHGQADLKGEFGELTVARLFARLASDRETGQLTVERGAATKDIYLVDGAPEFVSSNVPSERFGEYLVGRGVISPGELSMALAILPRFHGKLGDTLVGLSLLRPLEVFRHLTRQVRDKIIDVFNWNEGQYRFYRGRTNTRESFPLGLDAFEIFGAGVAGLPLEVVKMRLEKHSSKRIRKVERTRPAPEQFRVGAGPRELWQRLDGKRTVGDWMKRYDQPEQFLTLCRTMYLLIESDLASLD